MERQRNGETEKWRDREMERQRNGEIEIWRCGGIEIGDRELFFNQTGILYNSHPLRQINSTKNLNLLASYTVLKYKLI